MNIENRKRNIQGFTILVLTLTFSCLKAQENFMDLVVQVKEPVPISSVFTSKEKAFKPIVAMESWGTYSMGEEKEDLQTKNRADFSFRRLRFGASGSPNKWLNYNIQLHLDRLGEDKYAATKGSYTGLDIWNAFLTARLLKENEMLNLHVGYFWAAISREFNTSPWAVGSFDKTRANWYMRSFITGKGNGIESGLGLGGLQNYEMIGISYRLGIYTPQSYASSNYASLLYTGRLMVSFGEPEQKKYKYMLSGNQWSERIGVTVGIGASTQSNGYLSDTLFFNSSTAWGGDVLINYKRLRVEGEYFMFRRTATEFSEFSGIEWHVRMGYLILMDKVCFEPVVCYENYDGKGEKTLFKYIGNDNTLDVGINWYLNKDKLKLALHYVIQEATFSTNTGDFIGVVFQVRL